MFVTVQTIPIHVIDRGQGPPVLFLHGNPDSARVWEGVIDQMQDRFRCLAPDLPGFGDSGDGATLPLDLESLAAFVNDLVDALNLTPPIHLVVHDIGGPFGLAWVVRYGDRVQRIGILNTIFASDYRWHFFGRVWRTPVIGELSLALLNRPLFTLVMRLTNPELTPDQIRDMFENFDPAMKRMILRFYRATDPENFRGWEEALAAVLKEIPACVLWGDRDPYIPARFASQFGAQTVNQFAEKGHWLMLEDPTLVAQHLNQFFAASP